MNNPCTFEQGPSQRKRPIQPQSHANCEFECDLDAPFFIGPDADKEHETSHYLTTSEIQHDYRMQATTESTTNQIDVAHLVNFQDRSSSSHSPPERMSLPRHLEDAAGPISNPAARSTTNQTSLEFIPDAFSFYIGPTGVSDIHLLSQQQYDERKISRPNVRGLKYRVIDSKSRAGENINDYNFVPPTIFGITDRVLLDKAEPKVDYQTNESAWSELWQILDPMGAWHLIGLYSRFVDPYFPIVSQHQIPDSVDSLSNMSLGLLTAMCATALPFITYDEALYKLLLRPPSSQDLYRLAWLGVTAEIHAPSLTTLQACLILQQRLPTNLYLSDTAFTWTLMSTAVSVAQTVGLHRDSSTWLSVPIWERQLRRRLWWALWVMEKWVALSRGMPSHLHDDDSDVTPISISDIQNTLSSTYGDNHAHLCHLVSLTRILSDIQHTYYTVRAISRTSSDLHYSLDAARPLRARLKDWRDSVPDSLRFRARSYVGNGVQSPYEETLDGNGGLHLSYIVAHMSLFRALLRPLNNWPAIMVQSPADQASAIKEGAKAVVRGALLCVKEFVEFIETLTETQWNAFWHSCTL
jgi:Fungal specific transcription factor domain